MCKTSTDISSDKNLQKLTWSQVKQWSDTVDSYKAWNIRKHIFCADKKHPYQENQGLKNTTIRSWHSSGTSSAQQVAVPKKIHKYRFVVQDALDNNIV